jgi:hypothetical protein
MISTFKKFSVSHPKESVKLPSMLINSTALAIATDKRAILAAFVSAVVTFVFLLFLAVPIREAGRFAAGAKGGDGEGASHQSARSPHPPTPLQARQNLPRVPTTPPK